jgi:energy-coupling factor transporter ATP-binding protein EcfA2
MQFVRATRKTRPARVCLLGPTGSGKSMTALKIMAGLMQGGKFAAIDTERGSLSLYSDEADFDVIDLFPHSAENYRRAIYAASEAGYKGLLIDSLSHAWVGAEGALEQVDKAAKRNQGNSFVGWRDVTPEHNKLVDAIVNYPGHVVTTMRVKMHYDLVDNGKGKKMPVKVGLQPIQRDGIEYEFDVIADIDPDHNFIVSKTRCKGLDGLVTNKAGAEVAQTLLAWLNAGESADTPPASEPLFNHNVEEYNKVLRRAQATGMDEVAVSALWCDVCAANGAPDAIIETMAPDLFAVCRTALIAEIAELVKGAGAAA